MLRVLWMCGHALRRCARGRRVRASSTARCDREPEGEHVGRAVALDDDAAQPEQRRAVVAAVIDAPLEGLDHRQRDEPRELA